MCVLYDTQVKALNMYSGNVDLLDDGYGCEDLKTETGIAAWIGRRGRPGSHTQ